MDIKSKLTVDDILKLPEVGMVAFFQGNVRKVLPVRGTDKDGYHAIRPTKKGAPYCEVLKINGAFYFNESNT